MRVIGFTARAAQPQPCANRNRRSPTRGSTRIPSLPRILALACTIAAQLVSEAQPGSGQGYSIGADVAYAMQPQRHIRTFTNGTPTASASIDLRHIAAIVTARKRITAKWHATLAAGSFVTRTKLQADAAFADTSGSYAASASAVFGYALDPYTSPSGIFSLRADYFPYFIHIGAGRCWANSRMLTLCAEGHFGVLPVRGVQLQYASSPPDASGSDFLVDISDQADAGIHAYIGLLLRARIHASTKSAIIIGCQGLITLGPYFTSQVTIIRPSGRLHIHPDISRPFQWLALSLGYEFSWGRPPAKRERPDHRERAPYWPAG